MNIFIFSNSFIENTITYDLEYLLNIKIDTIILLAENHSSSEKLLCNKNIKLCLNSEEAVKCCDIALIVKYKELAQHLINRIIKICALYNKKYYCVEYPWQATEEYENKLNNSLNYSNIPTIVSLSIGQYHQQFHTELIIHKILSELKVDFYQDYSYTTKYFLNQIVENFNNPNNIFSENKLPYNIIVIPLSFKNVESMVDNKSLVEIFKRISPDFLIINIEAAINLFDHLKKLFLYKFNLNRNMFIISDYVSISSNSLGETRALYFEDNLRSEEICFNNSFDLEKTLRRKMLSKIAFPQDIILL